MRVLAILAVLLLLLAGCSAPEEARETRAEENLEITLNSIETPYAVGLPLWVTDEVPAEVWLAQFQQHFAALNLSLRETAYGTALWLEANASTELAAFQLRTVYGAARAEPHFFDGHYSLQDEQGRPGYLIDSGLVEVTAWSYDAVSENCWLSHVHSRTDPALGWNLLEGPPGDSGCV